MFGTPLSRLILIVGFLSQLAACGFHLRQEVSLPVALQSTATKGLAEYDELNLALQREFMHAGYPLLGDAKNFSATTVINVSSENITSRVLSVDLLGNANEYELQYKVNFNLEDAAGKEIVKPQTITTFRSYRNDPTRVLAKSSEEQHLKQDMVKYVAKQMLRRISKAVEKLDKPVSPSVEKPVK